MKSHTKKQKRYIKKLLDKLQKQCTHLRGVSSILGSLSTSTSSKTAYKQIMKTGRIADENHIDFNIAV